MFNVVVMDALSIMLFICTVISTTKKRRYTAHQPRVYREKTNEQPNKPTTDRRDFDGQAFSQEKSFIIFDCYRTW